MNFGLNSKTAFHKPAAQVNTEVTE